MHTNWKFIIGAIIIIALIFAIGFIQEVVTFCYNQATLSPPNSEEQYYLISKSQIIQEFQNYEEAKTVYTNLISENPNIKLVKKINPD